MSQSKFNIASVCRITNKSRNTIKKHLAQGKLSYTLDEDGAKVIDAAELLRVYPNECNFTDEERRLSLLEKEVPTKEVPTEREIIQLQERLDREVIERKREREQYREQVENLQQSLKLAQEGHNKATLLLEKQSTGAGGWEQGLKQLEERFAQEQAKMKAELQLATKRIGQYKNALEKERSKTFMQWLLTKKSPESRRPDAMQQQVSNKS